MSGSRGKGTFFAAGLCVLAIGLHLVGWSGFIPVALGQHQPTTVCVPAPNPCPACVAPLTYQCLINLNGWDLGACEEILPVGCFPNQTTCGDRYDCANPPNYKGPNGCLGIYDICT
jgi:hypothetical protein